MANDFIKIVWSKPPDQEIIPYLKQLPDTVLQTMEAVVTGYTDQITEWMQQNASWEDRTGRARESLRADVETAVGRIVRLYLYYDNLADDRGHDYGKYLENMQGGRFSILRPAMDEFLPRIQADLQAALGGTSPFRRRYTSQTYGDWGGGE
jgi:hypothetical protein